MKGLTTIAPLPSGGGCMSALPPEVGKAPETTARWYFSDMGVSVVYEHTAGDVATHAMVKEAIATSERRMATAVQRSQQYGHSHGDRYPYDERN